MIFMAMKTLGSENVCKQPSRQEGADPVMVQHNGDLATAVRVWPCYYIDCNKTASE